MSYPINWAHSYESKFFTDGKGFFRYLTIDITAYAKKEEKYLGKHGYFIDSFDVWEVKDSETGEELSHLLTDKELFPILKKEISEEIDDNEQYLIDKIEDEDCAGF